MRLAPLALLVGCGRIGFGIAGGTASDAVGEAMPDAAPCTFGPWGIPARIPELSSTFGDYGGEITRDGLSFYFRSDRTGAGDLFYGHRIDRASTFAVSAIPELDSAQDDVDISPSHDELEVYFTSARTGADCLFRAARTSASQPFTGIQRLGTFCSALPAAGPFLTDDGLTLYYNLENGSPEGTIYVTTRTATTAAFAAGAPIPELVDGIDKGYPALTSDGLTMYFESGSTHHISQTTRASLADPWGPTMPVPNINSPSNIDEDVSITGDGLELFFSSGRPGGVGADDVYHALRSCL